MSLKTVQSEHKIVFFDLLPIFCICKCSIQTQKEVTYSDKVGPLLQIRSSMMKCYSLLLCKLSVKAS